MRSSEKITHSCLKLTCHDCLKIIKIHVSTGSSHLRFAPDMHLGACPVMVQEFTEPHHELSHCIGFAWQGLGSGGLQVWLL